MASTPWAQFATLLPGTRVPVTPGTTRVPAGADLNGDGNADLVTCGVFDAAINVLMSNGDATFAEPVEYDGHGDPAGSFFGQPVAIGEFTGDGVLDIVTLEITTGGGSLSERHMLVYPGLGDGTFGSFIDTDVGAGSFGSALLAIADLNSDGRTDVALVDFYDQSCGCVRVAFGQGDGTFSQVTIVEAGLFASAIAIDDVNADGVLDIVVTATPYIITLLGHGDGTFENPLSTLFTSPLITYYGQLATAKLDGDAFPDLAVVGLTPEMSLTGRVELFRGLGHGDFEHVVSLEVPEAPADVHFTDWDGDGLTDILVSCSDDWTSPSPIPSGALAFAKGHGGFDFAPPVLNGLVGVPTKMSITDYNGDGRADIALGQAPAQDVYKNTVCVIFGSDHGQLLATPEVAANSDVHAFVATDMNGDGRIDLTMSSDAGLLVAMQDDAGAWQPALPVLPACLGFCLADLNEDGARDVVLQASVYPDNIQIALSRGDGTSFAAPVAFASGVGVRFATADMNNDNHLDILGYLKNSGELRIWPGNGDGTVGPPTIYGMAGVGGGIATADFDRDGWQDVVTTNSTLSEVAVRFGAGDGTLLTPVIIPSPAAPVAVSTGDFDNDGFIDLAVGTSGLVRSVTVFLGAGHSFHPATTQSLSWFCSDLVSADFDRDGLLDVVASNVDAGTLSCLRGMGGGNLAPPTEVFTSKQPVGLAAADFNADGFADLAVLSTLDDAAWIEFNASNVFSDLGHALAPPSSATPHLTGTGNPIPDQLVTLTVSGVPAPSFGLLFVGLNTVLQPFNGGVLVPSVDAAIPMRPAFPLSGRWPKGLDAGTPVYFQAWFATPGQGGAVSATNALVTIAE